MSTTTLTLESAAGRLTHLNRRLRAVEAQSTGRWSAAREARIEKIHDQMTVILANLDAQMGRNAYFITHAADDRIVLVAR